MSSSTCEVKAMPVGTTGKPSGMATVCPGRRSRGSSSGLAAEMAATLVSYCWESRQKVSPCRSCTNRVPMSQGIMACQVAASLRPVAGRP